MPEITTAGKILLKAYLPPEFRSFADKPLDSKGIGALFDELAKKRPDVYKKTVTDLSRLGFEVSTRQGSSVSLNDLATFSGKKKMFDDAEAEVDKIEAGTGTKADKHRKQSDVYHHMGDEMNKAILAEGLASNKTLAKVILSGSRGSATQYRQTVGAPGLITDAKGKPMLDFVVKNSYSEGLSLPEYLASSFNTRQGLVAVKLSVAEAGYLSKQLSRATMPFKVEEHDCGTDNGIPVSVSDQDSIGTYLAHPVADYKKNNEVTHKMLSDLANKKISSIVVRSPVTCQSSRKHHHGALCQLCVGKRERHTLPHLGDYAGMTAASTLGERLAQGQLSAKHSAGSAVKKSLASGFKLVNQLFNIPDTFKGKAALAFHDGTVTKIKEAPQGGQFVYVGTEEHYVPAGFDVKVKLGQKVEAGDQLSEGLINPEEIVRFKGIGEGRRYFTQTMHKAFKEGGMNINRRNFELISKAAVNHVRVTDPDGIGDYLPNQIVSYQAIEKDYKPRPGAKLSRPDLAYNKYLEIPVLHYTIGTRLTHSVIEDLKKHRTESVTVHENPPPFAPEMQRLLDVPGHEPDWMHQLYSTYLEKRFLNMVNTGAKSSLSGPSPVAGIAYGVGFGKKHPGHIKKADGEIDIWAEFDKQAEYDYELEESD